MRRLSQRKTTSKFKSDKHSFDSQFFYLILFLVAIGLVFVADISAPQALNFFNDKYHFFKSQLFAALIGIVVMYVLSFK